MKIKTNLALSTFLLVPVLACADNAAFNWYGSIGVQLQNTETEDVAFKDNYSRIGSFGSKEILNGVKAIYNFEFRLSADDGSFGGENNRARLANVGLVGEFGSFLIGKQYSPHWNFTDNAIDVFADIDESAGCTNESKATVCHTHRYGLQAIDASGELHYIEFLRPDRAITYISPDISGFQAALMAITNNGEVKSNAVGDESESIVGYNMAAKYEVDNLTLSASRFDLTGMEGVNRVDAVQIAYNLDQISLAARYQDSRDLRFYDGLSPAGETVEEVIHEIYAGYAFSNIQLQATYADISMDSPSALTVDSNQVVLDVIYKHKAGMFYVEYSAWGSEAEAVYNASDKFLAGYRFDF